MPACLGYKDVSECWNCTAGFHCSQPGRDAPIGPCDAGYYCPPGSSSPREVPCYPGTYCVGNNKEPELCPIGTYQPNYTRTSINDCINCTAGNVLSQSYSFSRKVKPCVGRKNLGNFWDSGWCILFSPKGFCVSLGWKTLKYTEPLMISSWEVSLQWMTVNVMVKSLG